MFLRGVDWVFVNDCALYSTPGSVSIGKELVYSKSREPMRVLTEMSVWHLVCTNESEHRKIGRWLNFLNSC